MTEKQVTDILKKFDAKTQIDFALACASFVSINRAKPNELNGIMRASELALMGSEMVTGDMAGDFFHMLNKIDCSESAHSQSISSAMYAVFLMVTKDPESITKYCASSYYWLMQSLYELDMDTGYAKLFIDKLINEAYKKEEVKKFKRNH